MVVRAGLANRETVGLLGIGSYWAVWIFRVFTYNVIPAIALAVIASAIFALAIGGALARSIKVLLLDEPYAGLAPVIVQEIAKTLDRIRDQGITSVIVQANAVAALRLADRAVILDTGKVVYDDSAQKVLDDEKLRAEYLAI